MSICVEHSLYRHCQFIVQGMRFIIQKRVLTTGGRDCVKVCEAVRIILAGLEISFFGLLVMDGGVLGGMVSSRPSFALSRDILIVCFFTFHYSQP